MQKLILLLILCGFAGVTNAQTEPHSFWLYGVSGGLNVNSYQGNTSVLSSTAGAQTPFTSGTASRPYAGLFVQFHPLMQWAAKLSVGYDNQGGHFNAKINSCGCTEFLNTSLNYVSVAPAVEFSPIEDLFLSAGPRFSVNMGHSFTYRETGDSNIYTHSSLSDMNAMLLSAEFGASYNITHIMLSPSAQMIIAPFVSFFPNWGNKPRDVESWNISTFRGGITVKFGKTPFDAYWGNY